MSKSKNPKRGLPKKHISQFRFCLIYFLPLLVIIVLFPYRDPVFLNNPYPFSAAFSGSTINFRMGFSAVPATIPAYSRPPLLSAIGIPNDLFTYQMCFYHNSFFKIKGKRVESDAVSLDVRVKIGSQTVHLPPNSHLCLPPDENRYTEIFVGNTMNDGNKAAELLEKNDKLPIEGKSEVLVKEKPIYSKLVMFLGILFAFYPLYWAVIIAWSTVHKFIHVKR